MNLRNGRGTQEDLNWSKRRGNDVNTVIIHEIINQTNISKRKRPVSTHSALTHTYGTHNPMSSLCSSLKTKAYPLLRQQFHVLRSLPLQ